MTESHNQGALDIAEAAKLLGVTPFALRKWKALGKDPAYFKAGRLVRYDRPDIGNPKAPLNSRATPRIVPLCIAIRPRASASAEVKSGGCWAWDYPTRPPLAATHFGPGVSTTST